MMSLSNWKGSSGWLSVKDPTGVLNGVCLQASSGLNQLCEDYLVKEIGTSNDFNKVHYTVQCDVAYRSDDIFDGAIALVARASDYTTSVKKPIVPQKAYIGVFDFELQRAAIFRRVNAKDSLLFSQDLSYSIQPNTKNQISLSCYGESEAGGTTLNLSLNGSILASFNDNSGFQILSGTAGIQVLGGTVYVNNFAIMELDSTGKSV